MPFHKIVLPLAILFTVISLKVAAQVNETATQGKVDVPLIADVPEKTEPVIPKRELKFDVSEEEESLPLQNVQEGMLDQRYVATFRLKRARIEDTHSQPRYTGIVESDPMFMYSGTFQEAYKYIEPSRQKYQQELAKTFRSFSFIQRTVISYFGPFHRFDTGLSQLPKGFLQEHPVSKETDADFIKNAPFVKVRHFPDPSAEFIEISLLAPGVEKAKKWTADWLAHYDWAVCYPAQKECLSLKNRLADRLPFYHQEAEKAKTELSNLKRESDKFKEFEDLKPESLANLITQRRMLSIDLVGLNARISACNKMLADKNAAQARKDQVETVKAAAEIELLGLEAKQQEINRIIQGTQDRQKHFARISHNQGKFGEYESLIGSTNNSLKHIDKYQLGFQALPVENDKVIVRRIKWASPSKP